MTKPKPGQNLFDRAVVDIGPVVVVVCFFLIDHAAMSRASLGLLALSTTTTLFILQLSGFQTEPKRKYVCNSQKLHELNTPYMSLTTRKRYRLIAAGSIDNNL